MAPLRAVAPIGVELTSLARFMEFYRAINWERVLRGALLRRWGRRVHLPLRRMPNVEGSLAATVLHGVDPPPVRGDPTLLCGERIEADDGLGAATAGCCRVLGLGGLSPHQPLELPAPLLAQFVDAAPACHQAPVLRLADEAFERPPFVCQTMAGALLFESQSGQCDAVVDGLRFGDAELAPDNAWRHVRIRGDVHTLDACGLARILPCVRLALGNTAAVLSVAGASDNQRRADAASFAGWLAGLVSQNSDDAEARRLRVLALYLSRIEGAPPAEGIFYGAMNERMGDHLAGISALAREADERLRDYDAQLWARESVREQCHRPEPD